MSPFDDIQLDTKHAPWYMNLNNPKPVSIEYHGQRYVSGPDGKLVAIRN